MSSVKVIVYGRIKPCLKSLQIQDFQLKYTNNEDYIEFSSPKTIYRKKSYRFQKIFDENASQLEIFEVVAKPIVQNVLSGYNGTIFTYGQTGSGKTYTMTGDIEKWVQPGLIPRTIQEIFKLKSKETVVSIAYCEIYNEHVYDLFRVDQIDSEAPQVSLLEDSFGVTHFRNLSVHIVATAYEALQLFIRGDANKIVAETNSNAKSSRSHVIFSISLRLPHPGKQDVFFKPVLYLVDLAGSEKLNKSKSSLTNPWETRYINLSLHYLEQVLVALRQPRRVHVPYRNSLVTALLRNSLGGNCLTAMIATFSLAVTDIDETVQTCRFAERIALIKNDVKPNEIGAMREIDVLKRENERLRAQLKIKDNSQTLRELTEEEKELCAEQVKNYIQKNDCFELPLTDIRRIEYCFWLMREEVTRKKKSSIAPESQSTLDPFEMYPMSEERFLLKSSSNSISLRRLSSGEKIWRRKRNQVDLPKVNITYKRSKSTEELLEEKEITENGILDAIIEDSKSNSVIIDDPETLKVSAVKIPSVNRFLNQNNSSNNFLGDGYCLEPEDSVPCKFKDFDLLPKDNFYYKPKETLAVKPEVSVPYKFKETLDLQPKDNLPYKSRATLDLKPEDSLPFKSRGTVVAKKDDNLAYKPKETLLYKSKEIFVSKPDETLTLKPANISTSKSKENVPLNVTPRETYALKPEDNFISKPKDSVTLALTPREALALKLEDNLALKPKQAMALTLEPGDTLALKSENNLTLKPKQAMALGLKPGEILALKPEERLSLKPREIFALKHQNGIKKEKITAVRSSFGSTKIHLSPSYCRGTGEISISDTDLPTERQKKLITTGIQVELENTQTENGNEIDETLFLLNNFNKSNVKNCEQKKYLKYGLSLAGDTEIQKKSREIMTTDDERQGESLKNNCALDHEVLATKNKGKFSPDGLPLTGDSEVDEEIVKFYKARYELFDGHLK